MRDFLNTPSGLSRPGTGVNSQELEPPPTPLGGRTVISNHILFSSFTRLAIRMWCKNHFATCSAPGSTSSSEGSQSSTSHFTELNFMHFYRMYLTYLFIWQEIKLNKVCVPRCPLLR